MLAMKTNTQPRKSSTNTRALSTRISNIQREMNPQVTVSGETLGTAPKQYVTRRYVSNLALTSGSVSVTPAAVAVPDGCKILKVVARNLTGRYLRLEVPYDSYMLAGFAQGTATDPFGGIKKQVSAPFSRFPTIKVNVPDLLANVIESTATNQLFMLTGTGTDNVELIFTVRYAL